MECASKTGTGKITVHLIVSAIILKDACGVHILKSSMCLDAPNGLCTRNLRQFIMED